nr:hypothetical protein CFP56_72081 [Quercus suber]
MRDACGGGAYRQRGVGFTESETPALLLLIANGCQRVERASIYLFKRGTIEEVLTVVEPQYYGYSTTTAAGRITTMAGDGVLMMDDLFGQGQPAQGVQQKPSGSAEAAIEG